MVNRRATLSGVHPEGEGRKGPARRRRRTPEVAESEIIAAAESFLREQPFRELTVDEVMKRTDLSRPSFYVYFTDRHQLVLKVVEHLGSELFTMSDRWLSGSGEGPDLARQALDGIVAVYVEHGPVMRALADAAADDPRETAKALVWMMERYLNLSLGQEPFTPAQAVGDTLSTIWTRVLYGTR